MEEAGICFQAYVPMRREPDERSEMTSQVLYGESFKILEQRKRLNYSLIRLDHDSYEGWIDSKAVTPLSESDASTLKQASLDITHDFVTILKPAAKSAPLHLSCGSIVRFNDRKVIDLTGKEYYLHKNFNKSAGEGTRRSLVKYGLKHVGVPYLWGGRSSFGFDCSGFTQNLYRQVGINIPRDSDLQSAAGRSNSFFDESKPGDLAFFDNDNGQIVHVGMIISKDMILHSSGRVRIDRIDHQGIYNQDLQKYTHKLRIVKNLVDGVTVLWNADQIRVHPRINPR